MPTGQSPDGVDLRCAPWTRALEPDPVGTAGRYDAFLLVEQPLPWPRDVSEMPDLAAAAAADPLVRVLAVAPEAGGAAERVRITRWVRAGAHRFVGTDHLVLADEVAEVVGAMAAQPRAERDDADAAAPPELLVCGHGRRDRCCGRWGTMLQTELVASLPAVVPPLDPPPAESGAAVGVRVRRCSHTGGHRFAPTGISLPDGRAWAYLDAAVAADVVARRGDPTALRAHYRGSVAVDTWAQPVERALFEALGWDWLSGDVEHVAVDVDDDGDAAEVHLVWVGPSGRGEVRATVGVRRRLPTLVCGHPPEEATKTSAELEVRSIAGLPEPSGA